MRIRHVLCEDMFCLRTDVSREIDRAFRAGRGGEPPDGADDLGRDRKGLPFRLSKNGHQAGPTSAWHPFPSFDGPPSVRLLLPTPTRPVRH